MGKYDQGFRDGVVFTNVVKAACAVGEVSSRTRRAKELRRSARNEQSQAVPERTKVTSRFGGSRANYGTFTIGAQLRHLEAAYRAADAAHELDPTVVGSRAVDELHEAVKMVQRRVDRQGSHGTPVHKHKTPGDHGLRTVNIA